MQAIANTAGFHFAYIEQGGASLYWPASRILPEPADFISKELPPCSVIRPSLTEHAGAVATILSFTNDLLFAGQPREFFETVMALAIAADAAQRAL